jgi:4-hydroxybenzoate polyprenyltransferase
VTIRRNHSPSNDRRSLAGPGTWRRLDEFLRIYQIGFVAVWPLLGLAGAGAWTFRSVAALVAIGACFNVAGGVFNDICDLPSDRQSQNRTHHWLITGTVSVRQAWMVALAQIPLMLSIHLVAGFRPESLRWLATSVIGQAFYDHFGKKCRYPPVAEAGQGIAAAGLVMFGATCSAETMPFIAWPTAVSGGAMLMLANAFHGGLRDLRDDVQSCVRTTPIWLGCFPGVDDVRISPAMSVYAGCWLAVLLAASIVVAAQASSLTRLAAGAGSVIDVVLFVALHRLRGRAWDIALRAHVAMLPIPMMTAVAATLDTKGKLLLSAAYFLPVLPLTWTRIRAQWSARPHDVGLGAAHAPRNGTSPAAIAQENAPPRSIRPYLYLRRFVDESGRPPHADPEQAGLDRQL